MGCVVLGLGTVTVFGKSRLLVLFNFDLSGDLREEGLGVLQQAAIVMMTGGAATILLCFLGFVGVLRGSKTMLYAYTAIVFIIVCMQIAAVALAFYYRRQIKLNLKTQLLKSLQKHYDGGLNPSNPFSLAIDFAQLFFGCCGITSYENFKNTPWHRAAISTSTPTTNRGNSTLADTTSNHSLSPDGQRSKDFPITCCKLKDPVAFLKGAVRKVVSVELYDPNCPMRVASMDNPYTGLPCIEAAKNFILDRAITIFYLALVIVCLEIIGVLNSLAIVRNVGERQQERAPVINHSQRTFFFFGR